MPNFQSKMDVARAPLLLGTPLAAEKAQSPNQVLIRLTRKSYLSVYRNHNPKADECVVVVVQVPRSCPMTSKQTCHVKPMFSLFHCNTPRYTSLSFDHRMEQFTYNLPQFLLLQSICETLDTFYHLIDNCNCCIYCASEKFRT